MTIANYLWLTVKATSFYITSFITCCILGICGLPLLLLPNRDQFSQKIIFLMNELVLLQLKLFCGIEIIVRGAENIPKSPCLIAAKHQSALDIMVLIKIFYNPIFVSKKTVKLLPVIGLYGIAIKTIFINRNRPKQALRDMMIGSEKAIAKYKRSVIIFPEGTRTKPGQNKRLNQGIAVIYSHCKTAILPIALNSGLFWQRNAIFKKPGKCIVQILPIIKMGFDKKNVMQNLEKIIHTESNKLI